MATLQDGCLSLVIDNFDEQDEDVCMALGLFCNGVPLLQEVSNRHNGLLARGFVWTDDSANEEIDLVALLRPAMEDRRPRAWHDLEHCAHIMLYPPAYRIAIHPVDSIPWDETWPALARDLRQGFLQQARGAYGIERPDPNHQRPPEDDDRFVLQVCISPSAIGHRGWGYITLELVVQEAVLAAFFDTLRAERRAFVAAHRPKEEEDEDG